MAGWRSRVVALGVVGIVAGSVVPPLRPSVALASPLSITVTTASDPATEWVIVAAEPITDFDNT